MAEIKLQADSGGGTSSLKGPASTGNTPSWRLPSADGSSGQYLKTDGSGTLSFATVSGGIPTTGGTFTGDVTFTGDAANVTWDKSTDDLIFNDNAKAIFGTSSDGLEVFHNSENSYIKDTGTGALVISTSDFYLNNAADTATVLKATETGLITTPKQPVCIVSTSANPSFSSGSQKYPLNSISYERHQGSSNYDASTNYRFTCPVAGVYLIDVSLNLYGLTNDNVKVSVKKNGSTDYALARKEWQISEENIHGAAILSAAVNDYFEIWINPSDSGTGSGGWDWTRATFALLG